MMARDAFDLFSEKPRGRCGDNEAEDVRGNDSVRSDLVDVTLIYRHEKPLALAVSEIEGTEWIWLPKSEIEFERKPKGQVLVTLPRWLVKMKGLV